MLTGEVDLNEDKSDDDDDDENDSEADAEKVIVDKLASVSLFFLIQNLYRNKKHISNIYKKKSAIKCFITIFEIKNNY